MTEREKDILVNIVGGVESGGQIYGKRDYGAYAGRYQNSPTEYTCTLGWAQNCGYNAMRLCKMIFDKDPAAFRKADTANIESKLNVDWVKERWNPSSSEKKALISIITTDVGKKCQDEKFINDAGETIKIGQEQYGISDFGIMIMFVEIAHLGGVSAAQRIFNKLSGRYDIDDIYATLLLDQKDTYNSNQVGDKIYQSRHACCVRWIKEYLYTNTSSNAAPTSSTVSIGTYQVSGNMISNSGSDERGSYHSGTAGDQTGKEWQIRTWYNRPWNCVIRHPNETVRRKLSELSILAAKNDRIGYDQYERNTYWNQLQKVNYDPSKITVNCEADCSAGVIANTKAVGYLMGLSALKNITATYTGNMRDSYRNAGFTILTDSKYLTSPDYLLPGDILLNDVHHVCVCVSTGSKSGGYVAPSVTPSSSATSSILKKGSSGSAVKTMQTMLIKLGYSCGGSGADGEFGANTDTALKKFQKDNNLEVDGEYGPASKAKLEDLYSKATTKTSTVEAAMYKDAALAGTYRVTASSLNVRLTNDTSSNNNIVEVLHTEEKVTCYGYYNIKKGVKWLLVVTPTGKTGYVCATYVKK